MWCIYYIYGVSSGYIQQYSRLNLGFFRPRQKNSLGQHDGVLPSGIFQPRTKKTLGFGAILLYVALKNTIYTLHINVLPLS